MRHKQSQQHPFKVKSNWTPRSTENTKLESYLEATKLALLDLPFQKVTQNMSHAQKIEISKLANNSEITIKPYDKGRGIVIVNTKDYVNECERQLRNTEYYTKLDSDETEHTINKVHVLLNKMYMNKPDMQTTLHYDPNIDILASLLEEQEH